MTTSAGSPAGRKRRVLIVDDEALARRGLEIRLAEFEDFEVCGQSRNGREALRDLAEHKPELVFLDIQMPGMDGFEVLRRMAGPDMPAVIFVTAYAEHAIRAFEANALDYLLKPIDEPRLRAALDRAREQLDTRAVRQHRERLLKLICELTGKELTLQEALQKDVAPPSAHPEQIAIRDGRETIRLAVDDIQWIDAAGDYLCVHTPLQTYVIRGTMKKLERLLDPARFIRVHRSTIVNGGQVRSMRSHTNGEYFLTLDCDKQLKLSRTYRKNLDRLRPASETLSRRQ
ncbi:MAG: LytTR family DNA-binding domain-containing protein [Pseudomonadota bacterium]